MRYFVRQHSMFALFSLSVCIFDCWWLWETQRQSKTLTMREMGYSLVFVLLYSELNELTMIYRHKTVSIRVYQIEPNSFINKYIAHHLISCERDISIDNGSHD